MKILDIKPNIESSGILEEQFFSIQDQGMIFDILRNKMYSNPILAICREISCNARDAHREVKTPEVPVHIHLPNNLEPFYKIKDFGPGISPDRMSNIFIKYTASTKRSDNVQTGGFGLGAKTPFSYSDTFSIITNYNGVQYNYSCFIDETKVGKLALFSEAPTKEPNGTEIIIPVKTSDFNSFRDWTEKSTRHWEVKPIIKGGNVNWVTAKKILDGDNWFIGTENGNDNYYGASHSCKLIIDGIEYPVELDALRKYADTKIIDAARGNLYLYFGVGELSLSASRESVYLDKPTQLKISQRLKEVSTKILKIANDKIAAFPNLWEANLYYRKDLQEAFHNLSFLGSLSWQGIPLSQHSLQTACNVYSFSKHQPYRRRSSSTPSAEKIRRYTQRAISFDPNSTLFVNDLSIKEPTPRHIKKAFDDNPTLTSIQVICPNDKVSLQQINDDYHVDKMDAKMLSTITKASSRKYTPSASRLLVFKFDPLSAVFRQVSYSSIDEDTNDKVLCKLARETYNNFRQIRLANKSLLSNATLKSLAGKYATTSFYGLDDGADQERIDEDFSDFRDVEDFLKKEILDNSKINYVEIKFATKTRHYVEDKTSKLLNKLSIMIKDPDSLYMKRILIHNKIRDLRNADKGLLDIYESVNGEIAESAIEDFVKNNPDYNLDELDKKYNQKYPLLAHIHTYSYQDILPAVTQYVNLLDSI